MFDTQSLPRRFTPTSGDISALKEATDRRTDPASVPHATEIAREIPIYDAAALPFDPGDERDAVMDEIAAVFLDGPGVIVLRGAVADASVVDRATAVFDAIIDAERAAGTAAYDHFAKPGANDRVWNALQKHCLADPENFARYFASPAMALVCEAWLGPGWQMTAQVNRVNPGGAAQSAHRDYHLGFMPTEKSARFPVHVHLLSPALTLQGGIAHVEMSVQSGPTQLLPFSQTVPDGYLSFPRPEYQDLFAERAVQLPMSKGDAVFFNPALMHAAGENKTEDVRRLVNLLQVSSAFGRSIEAVDRAATARAVYPVLQTADLPPAAQDAVIAAAAEDYAFPTNLDTDPPQGGLAPPSMADLMHSALAAGDSAETFADTLAALGARQRP